MTDGSGMTDRVLVMVTTVTGPPRGSRARFAEPLPCFGVAEPL